MTRPLQQRTAHTNLDRPLIVIGGGDHAQVLIDLIGLLDLETLFITDHDLSRHDTIVYGLTVRGDDNEVLKYDPQQVLLVNAVGSVAKPMARQNVFTRFKGHGYQFASLIHPSAVISSSAQLGEGVQIMASAVVQANAVVGNNTLINTKASIDHDCVLGEHIHVAPGVTLSGKVTIGDTTHLGTGATVIQGIRIGREVLVAAGAVVVRNVPDESMVMGVPAVPASKKASFVKHRRTRVAGGESQFHVMLSAVGRRVTLLKLLRRSLEELQLPGKILATDINRISSAFHVADAGRIVPDYNDPRCLEETLSLCQEYKVRVIVPTIDPDLPFYAEHQKEFEDNNVQVMVSSPETIRICNDKKATYEWLTAHNLPCLRYIDAHELFEDMNDWSFPLFIKPRHGSSSINARVIRDHHELRAAVVSKEFIAQEVAGDEEYTVDVYVDRRGRCRCAVPRLRMATRGGEVSKGMTVRSQPLQSLARRVAEALPGARGVMNIQIFYDEDRQTLAVNDINARFGGGYPLTHQAGAPMVRWMLEEVMGLPLTAEEDRWVDGLVMLRYDEAVFVSDIEAGIARAHAGKGPSESAKVH